MTANQDPNLPSYPNTDNTESKKWLIYEMLDLLEANNRQLHSNKHKFENFTADILSDLTDKRNVILTGIAIIVTALAAFAKDYEPYSLYSISASSAIGLFVYGYYEHLKRKIRSANEIVENAYSDGEVTQNFMKGFLDMWGSYLYTPNSISSDQLCTLHEYYVVLQGGIVSSIIRSYPQKQKSNIKLYNGLGMELYELLVNNAYDQYLKNKSRIESKQFLNLFKISKGGEGLKVKFDGFIRGLEPIPKMADKRMA